MIKKVSFDEPTNIVQLPKEESKESASNKSTGPNEKRTIAKAKAKYRYPWWASKNPVEVFWGQLNESVQIVSAEKFHSCAKEAMGREVFQEELEDRETLKKEFIERIPKETLDEITARIHGKTENAAQQTVA
jgi:hypothetical protein